VNPRIYLCVLATFAINTDNFAIAGILLEISRSFHVPLGIAGQLVTVYALTYGLGAPLLAVFLASFSSRWVLIAALLGFSLTNAASALAPSFGFLIGCRILAGACAAIVSPASYALAATLASDAKRGLALALIGAGSSAATIVGLPVGAWIGQTLGWPLTFGLIAGLSTVASTVLGLIGIPSIPAIPGIGLLARFSLMVQPRLVLALLPTLFWSLAHFLVYTYVVPLLQVSTHMENVSGMILVWGIGSVIGNWLGGYLVDHIGSARTLLSSLFLLAITLSLLPILSIALPMTMGLLFLWGVAVWATWPALQHRLHHHYPQSASQVLALNASLDFLGSAAGAGAGGLLLSTFPIQALAWFGGTTALIALIFVLLSL